MQKKWIRVVVDVGMGIGVVTLPWYVSAVLLIGLIVYYPLYIEGLFFAFLFDTLYAQRYVFPFTALTITTAFLLVTYFVKTRIRR